MEERNNGGSKIPKSNEKVFSLLVKQKRRGMVARIIRIIRTDIVPLLGRKTKASRTKTDIFTTWANPNHRMDSLSLSIKLCIDPISISCPCRLNSNRGLLLLRITMTMIAVTTSVMTPRHEYATILPVRKDGGPSVPDVEKTGYAVEP